MYFFSRTEQRWELHLELVKNADSQPPPRCPHPLTQRPAESDSAVFTRPSDLHAPWSLMGTALEEWKGFHRGNEREAGLHPCFSNLAALKITYSTCQARAPRGLLLWSFWGCTWRMGNPPNLLSFSWLHPGAHGTSRTRDRIQAPCTGSMGSSSLGHQGEPPVFNSNKFPGAAAEAAHSVNLELASFLLSFLPLPCPGFPSPAFLLFPSFSSFGRTAEGTLSFSVLWPITSHLADGSESDGSHAY